MSLVVTIVTKSTQVIEIPSKLRMILDLLNVIDFKSLSRESARSLAEDTLIFISLDCLSA
jgi:hypothetical protein